MTAAALRRFLDDHPRLVLVEVREARGSTPREAGASMLVGPDATLGTIGGGQLEWLAIARAREMLGTLPGNVGAAPHLPAGTLSPQAGGGPLAATPPPRSSPRSRGEGGGSRTRGSAAASEEAVTLDIPLGPDIGQCCGGRVLVGLRRVDEATRDQLLREAEAADDARPRVLLFGAGHVGHALASALAPLPVRVSMVETRADALDGLPAGVEARLTPVPEEAVRAAAPGSAFVVLTHDHALDFLVTAEALKRGDASYVGMIGSRTKRNTFRSWFAEQGGSPSEFARLTCPIGGSTVRDKRPAVIAALAAAEIVAALLGGQEL